MLRRFSRAIITCGFVRVTSLVHCIYCTIIWPHVNIKIIFIAAALSKLYMSNVNIIIKLFLTVVYMHGLCRYKLVGNLFTLKCLPSSYFWETISNRLTLVPAGKVKEIPSNTWKSLTYKKRCHVLGDSSATELCLGLIKKKIITRLKICSLPEWRRYGGGCDILPP